MYHFGHFGVETASDHHREMAVGNTFGATALSSYGGFWLSFAVILTPGGFQIPALIEEAGGPPAFFDSFGFFLMVSPCPS